MQARLKWKSSLLLVMASFALPHDGHGQGTVNFSNLVGPSGTALNAPVTNLTGQRIVGPSPYVADLYWSSDSNALLDSLVAAGFNQPFSTITLSGGYFLGGVKTLPTVVPVLVQVRVWDTTYGATYAQARDNGGEFGASNPILLPPLDFPPGSGTPLTGLQGFQLGRIPEPSASLLAVVGGAMLIWLRKRNCPCKHV